MMCLELLSPKKRCVHDFSRTGAGHPLSVDTMIKVDEDTVLTGSGDGMVRILSIQPHSLLGVLAQQEEGCERMALSHDRQLLATVGFDCIRLWDTSCLDQDDEDDDEGPPQEAVGFRCSILPPGLYSH